MSQTPFIQVGKVNFEWPLYHKTLKQKHSKYATLVGGALTQKKDSIRVHALNNISFELHSGDRLALVGHNGAGKSTLLRLLAGIYAPTSGKIKVNGKISTLFTNAIGLQPDATGYENILLMGKLLGINNITTKRVIREIEEFSELGEFLNLPLRTYSAGMRTRLGFTIATCIDANILLIDEVIGAGDEKFQRRAAQRIEEKINTAGALVLALHSTISLRMFCNLALWLDGGSIRKFGPIEKVLSEFEANIING